MPFEKGISGNPLGKPVGAKNGNTERLRAIVADLLDENFEQIRKDFAALKPRERVQAWTSLLEFSLPKLQRSEMTLNIDSMSDEEVDLLLRRALNIAENQPDNEDGQENDSNEDSNENANQLGF